MNEATVKTLKRVAVGEEVTVVKVAGEGPLRQRILDMGLTKGAAGRLRKVAPLGDPFELHLRGYELSIRKMDAEMIEIL